LANSECIGGLPNTGITVNPGSAFATASAVPEPSEMLMMTTGLGLVGFMLRRRKAVPARVF